MRKKGLAGILSLLICIAIVGVGFASWVISGNATKDVTGTVVVDTITDNRVEISVTPIDQTITLAGKESDVQNIGNAWLTTDKVQDLVLECEYSVSFKDGREGYTGISVSAEKTLASEISALVTNNYITVGDPVVTQPDAQGKGTITVTFAWGSKFGNKNPYTYYNNDKDCTDTNVNEAKTALGALLAAQNTKITIKVTATYNPAA